MPSDIRWAGLVTEDGKHFFADERRAFGLWLAKFAGQEVEVVVRRKRRRPSKQARGYYWSTVVTAFAEHIGEESLLVAHLILKRLILCTPDMETPSTSDAEFTSEQLADLTLKAAAFLSHHDIHVPEPERDPVRRLELVS